MPGNRIDRKRYRKSMYYKYLLKTGAFIRKTGMLKSGKWIYYGLIIGVVAAFGAAVFMKALDFMSRFMLEGIGGHSGNEMGQAVFQPGLKKWAILLLPAAGALVAGLISAKIAPDTKGHGTDDVIKSFHKQNGNISLKTAIAKIFATIFVIGSGGSAGREGPIAQIGAGFASFFGRKMKVPARDRRIMLISGAGAGISAIFGAPLGGAIFAVEVMYRNQDMESEALIPSIISSIVSFSLFRAVFGKEHLFNISGVFFESAYELVPYTLLGVICAVVGVLYVKTFYSISGRFKKMKIKEVLKPAVGGFLVGAMGIFFPQVLAGGYGYIQMAFDGLLPLNILIILVVGKILATSFTIGSGGSGGVFAPSLFIGAMLGGSVGGVFQHVFPPEWMPVQAAFVVVGMGGFFAGVARVPLSSLFMVMEMTGGYELLVPMMLVASTAFLLNRKPFTLYREQAKSILDSPAHKGDFEIDVLEDIRVGDITIDTKDIVIIPRRMPLEKVVEIITHTTQDTFPVVDTKEDARLTGVFTLEDIREELSNRDVLEAAVADDISFRDFEYVTPEDDLHFALHKFIKKDYDALPVLEKKTKKLLGLLTRTHFIREYNKRFAEMKKKP